MPLLQAGGYEALPGAANEVAVAGSGLPVLVWVLIIGVALGVGLLLLLALIKQFRCICRPNEILIFTGRTYVLPNGHKAGTFVLSGGGRWRWPIIERVERMDITTIPIKVPASAYSRGGIQLRVDAIANVKISSDERHVRNAIERFLGRDRAEVAQVARQTLEGNLRGVLAKLTPEEVNEDRLRFADELSREAGQDLAKLGLQVDTLKIQSVTDDAGYLEAIGRKRVAEILKEAEVAESDAERESKTVAANAKAEGDIAKENAQKSVLQKTNESRRIAAECEALVEAEIRRTEAAAQAARALAEQELQSVRKEVERARLQAEVVVPAEAERRAREIIARGEAAPVEADGKANADAMRMLAESWGKAGTQARDVFLIQQLEGLTDTVVDAVKQVSVKNVSLIDGGDGRALPSYVASFPAMVNAVLEQLAAGTGVDIPAALRSNGGASRVPFAPTGGSHG